MELPFFFVQRKIAAKIQRLISVMGDGTVSLRSSLDDSEPQISTPTTIPLTKK